MDLAQFLFVPAQFVKPGDLISFAALCAFDVILCLCRELLVGGHLSPASDSEVHKNKNALVRLINHQPLHATE